MPADFGETVLSQQKIKQLVSRKLRLCPHIQVEDKSLYFCVYGGENLRFERNHGKKVRHKKRIPARHIMFPSDYLTQEQRDALNGPVVIIRPAKK